MLSLPPLDTAIDFLKDAQNPTVDLRLGSALGWNVDIADARGRLDRSVLVTDAMATQRSDGSWGEKDHPGKRLLPTLWMVKTLGELGLDRTHAGWMKAVEFLVEVGHTDGDVFSIWGNREGVLSCYVGITALIYLDGGLAELAAPQMDWILRYQEIRVGGEDRRTDQVAVWGPHLKTKYGGCMAETTCLVGLLREGRALAKWGQSEGLPLVESIREAFLERKVMYSSSGSILPLAVSPKKADSWLAPSFPLDWRIDLIEAVDFIAHTGPADGRLQEAIDKVAEYQLPDGTWPLRRTYRPSQLPGLEHRSSRRGSPMVTLRAVEALRPLHES